jgi:hypothetical protein
MNDRNPTQRLPSQALDQAELQRRALSAIRESEFSRAWDRVLAKLPGLEVYLAGGALRNLILGRQPKDFDFFLAGKAVDEALASLAALGHLDRGPFGSPRWFPAEGAPAYADLIPVETFSNGLWHCADITDVLNQFDFTLNALAVDLRTGRWFNPQNALRDLSLGVMRAVRFDYPDEPIAPGRTLTRPAVLWCRLLHYAALLKLTIEPVTLEWLCRERRFRAHVPAFVDTFFPLHPQALTPVSVHPN